ncbi:MAG: SDR family oxidoreductase [Anaerolineaceae bacterium]|nr:SDR family oxidoreductase [Anaerolineaceae bacterium]
MHEQKPVAIVGIGAIMPDAHDAAAFWNNIKSGRYSITDVPVERWRADLYFHPDPSVPEKTYSKIGGWVKGFQFEPFKWGIAIPPRVLGQMDEAQQWAIAACRQALVDYGHPQRHLDISRTGVILGNALGGEKHYNTTLRIRVPEFAEALSAVPDFQQLSPAVQQALLAGLVENIRRTTPEINEDTMPGELSNVIAGRVANVFNLTGPNFVTDAACASSLAALQSAVEGLNAHNFDAVLTGGVDRGMGVEAFVKFSKIGALSADGSRPYADGANGFVMGEGAGIFLLKRLEDAERDGDKIYAVIRGIGSSSDGKGKGITAPNPNGQIQAVTRAWTSAGLSPATATMIEGHGTSTRVGDVVEVNSLNTIFGQFGLPVGSIALGSVKSNVGHLKSAAGAAGLFKAAMALHEKVLPPTANFERPNPNLDFSQLPLRVNTRLQEWEMKPGEIRRAGVSAFGFGGTNFHVVLEEYIPGMLAEQKPQFQSAQPAKAATPVPAIETQVAAAAQPYRGLLFLSADSVNELKQQLAVVLDQARQGTKPQNGVPSAEALGKAERLAIDYGDLDELVKRGERALKGLEADPSSNPWQALQAHSVFRGSGAPGKLAIMFPGQGSQYVNMLKDLCAAEPLVAETFAEADRVMEPILGRPLTSYIYVEGDEASLAEAEKALRNTEITQPALLTANVAILRLMRKFGFQPELVIGHSLGEYAALVAAGVLTFEEALQVVSARGREMKKVSVADNGCMAAVSAPIAQVEEMLKSVKEYVVLANINSPVQSVIGGSTAGVEEALAAFQAAGLQATKIPVSHAFHTKIVAAASQPLRGVIAGMSVNAPRIKLVANVTGELYPTEREKILDILAAQVASPVQFIKGVDTLYREGARVFVECGPKRVMNALATDCLKEKRDVTILATNHPRKGAVVSFNEALCGLYAAGVGGNPQPKQAANQQPVQRAAVDGEKVKQYVLEVVSEKTGYPVEMLDMELDLEADLGIDTVKQAELFATIRTHYELPRREDLRLSDYNNLTKVVQFMCEALGQKEPAVVEPEATPVVAAPQPVVTQVVSVQDAPKTAQIENEGKLPLTGSVVVTGAGLGLPGRSKHVFNDDNIRDLLRGENRIEAMPDELRQRMIDKRVTRLVKSEAGAVMEVLDQADQAVKLGGQRGAFDLVEEFGVPAERVEAFDISTQLAIAAGIEALRDAGIPLVMAYRQTSKGTFLPERWKLPESLQDETGVIFGSAFPGLDEMAEETGRFGEHEKLAGQLNELRGVLALVPEGQNDLRAALEKRIGELEAQLIALNYQFDRKFVFRVLAMGHSQFAEYIGARGPNTHVNAACATTTHALAVAEDWIRSGRCRRVIVVAGDDVTGGALANWIGTGMLASGAATVEGDVRMAVLPFDRRRNGMIMGMGGAALVVEAADAAAERGARPICEVLSTQIANSAFHGTRLDTQHVGEVMERLVRTAEERFGLDRSRMAAQTVFVSHETYTPARGGSASAEIRALRQVFGEQANRVVIANTKGYTGHAMGVGVEDVLAVKALENQQVPPIANIHDGFEPDPELGDLNLSLGGQYDVQYALRLGAGFGSQIALTLMRRVPGVGERIDQPKHLRWLAEVCGYVAPELETVQRTLRVKHTSAPQKAPAKSKWQYGQGPTMWVSVETPAAVESAVEPAQEAVAVQVSTRTTVATDSDAIKAYVLEVVSEKTGYPVEMLDMELDLEADLGIDTVKQAELFATIRTHYDIPRREDLRLSDYNTLTKVVQFMREALGSVQPAAVNRSAIEGGEPVVVPLQETLAEGVSSGSFNEADSDAIKAYVLDVVSEKTGYPIEMLDMELDLEADLGIDTVKQAELFATIRTHYDIPRREDLRLSDYNTLTKVVQFMREALGGAQPAAASEPVVELGEAVATQAAEAPVPMESLAGADGDAIKAYVLEVVSEKTGYPVEMLDMELDLEADLGIDTVKQAELFATIRTHYDIPRREDLRLSDYNTLTKVVQFMGEALAAKQAEAQPVVEDIPTAVEAEAGQAIARRVPVPILRPKLDLCVPTGVTLGESSRVVIVADRGKVASGLARRLRGRKAQVLTVDGENSTQAAEKVAAFQAESQVQGVYFLVGLDVEAKLAEMDAESWQREVSRRAEGLYTVMRAVQGEPFLVCATRMGGLHGCGPDGASAPLGGLVSGFAKALAWERPGTLVKVVDFNPQMPDGDLAGLLLRETLNDPGAVEVGWDGDLRFTLALAERPADEGHFELPEGSVFVVSGGSGGITGPILVDLARATRGKFYLLSRTPLPERNSADLVRLKADKNAFKKELMARLLQEGGKPTPAQVDQRVAALERAAATLDTINAVETAGGRAVYLVCDVTDAASVIGAIAEIGEERVDVFIHAAGSERSRKLDNKPVEEFRQTVGVKAMGFFHVFKALEAAGKLPRAVVMFSSVAGRFGNTGQTDYSAANDLLGKLAAALPKDYPQLKALTVDWGAWAEVGMASRGFIPELMKRAGIEMLQPETGAGLVRRELLRGTQGGEILLAGSLGLLEGNRHPDGGLDVEAANRALTSGEPIHTMFSRVSRVDLQTGVLLEAELDPQAEPFLKDHAMNGIPLLPGVMGIEGFSVAARHIASVLASERGSFLVTGLEDIQFLAPFKFYRDQKRQITWKAQGVREASGLVVYVTLESTSVSKVKKDEKLLHFSGKVNLCPVGVGLSVSKVKPPHWNGGRTISAEDIYKLYFHGPAFQVLEGVQMVDGRVLGKLQANLPPIMNGESSPITPVLIELCLQTAGVWEIGRTGALALPQSIREIKLYEAGKNGAPIFAEVAPVEGESGLSFTARVVDGNGQLFLELEDYRTSALNYSMEADLLKPLKDVVGGE